MSDIDPVENKLLGDSHSRFVDYAFGNVITQNLEITQNLIISGITTGTPLDGATVTIPPNISVVIIQNTLPYTQLTFVMPLKPQYGQILTIVCNVAILNFSLVGSTFGTVVPTNLAAGRPYRIIYAGSWFAN